MRALAIRSQGGVESASVMDVAEPTTGPGEVKVALRAAAFNHLDLWTVRGQLPFEISFPFVLGADGEGIVTETGDGVEGVAVRDRVIVDPALYCGDCEMCRAGDGPLCRSFEMLGEHRNGTMAEYVVVPARNVYPAPAHLTDEQAAALGVTFITAYRMLFTRGRLKPGESVLITGIGGGLALSLLQLAAPVAGRIFVTSSEKGKIERAKALGAHDGFDYTSDDVAKAVRAATGKRGVDLVVDSAGGPTIEASMRALRRGGRLVVAGATAGSSATIDVRRLFWNQIEILGSTMGTDSDVRAMLANAGAFEPVIDSVYPLERAAEGLARLASGAQFGKLVVTDMAPAE